MKKSLIAMAAGMGSRFGGLKQAAKFGKSQKTMLDFALEDALEAGFEEFVFVIRRGIEKIFRESVSGKYENLADVRYVVQDESGQPLPAGRSKPWGTGHAVLACADEISGPFLAVNADDYYGRSVYALAANFMDSPDPHRYALAGYRLKNTLSKNGGVSRGICETDGNLRLVSIRECAGLRERTAADGTKFVESEDGEKFSGGEFVSLNFWAFPKEFMERLGTDFEKFLSVNSKSEKAEFYLPKAVDGAVAEKFAETAVMPTDERWQGVTYRADAGEVEKFLESEGRI